MERPEPKIGDPLINNGYRSNIERFHEDGGTWLRNGFSVCISEFEKGGDGVWRRPEPHGITGLVDLERPATESGLEALKEAAAQLRSNPARFGMSAGTAELTASIFDVQVRMGSLDLDLLNRTGGPEIVRLARHLLKEAEGAF